MEKNNKTLVLIGLLLGLIFAELDETVVSTAMPTISVSCTDCRFTVG